MTSLNLDNKVALVTGASSGLGAHFARVLAKAGAKVAVCARRKEKLETLVAEIAQDGGQAAAFSVDVTDEASISSAIADAEAEFGVIDVLVNNAGVARSNFCLKNESSDYDFIMDTNLRGAWITATLVARRMIDAGVQGSIINIASILGLHVGFGESTYAMSKAGVVQMTKAMALELGRKNVRVNAICPGYFNTEMNEDYFNSEQGMKYIESTPAARLGELDELSGPLLLLASEAGSFINGVALPVDGGHLVRSL